MIKRAFIVRGMPFDWEKGSQAINQVVDPDGNVNWKAACSADPGVIHCPTCETYFWREGVELECSSCGTHFQTLDGKITLGPCKHQYRSYLRRQFWLKIGRFLARVLPYKKRGRWYWFNFKLNRKTQVVRKQSPPT